VNQRKCIVVFVRSPEKGTVKTRLTAVLDEDTVLDLYRRFVLDLLETLSRTTFDLRICFHPADAGRKLANWLGEKYVYLAQQGGDLGERLENAFRAAFTSGFRSVVIIGSDSPDLPREILVEAFNSLTSKDAVIGPAMDGGYYLIGFNSGLFLKEVLTGIEWGTPTVFRRTVDILSKRGCNVQVLPSWPDIDTYEDVLAFMRRHELMPAGRLRTLDYLRARQSVR
jgi:uncharacterized protein